MTMPYNSILLISFSKNQNEKKLNASEGGYGSLGDYFFNEEAWNNAKNPHCHVLEIQQFMNIL